MIIRSFSSKRGLHSFFRKGILLLLPIALLSITGCGEKPDVDTPDADADKDVIITKIEFTPSEPRNEHVQTISVKNTGEVYLVKVNKGKKEFAAGVTGKVAGASARNPVVNRSALSEEQSYIEADADEKQRIAYDIKKYREFNEVLNSKGLKSSLSRSAASIPCELIQEKASVGDKKDFYLEGSDKSTAECKYIGEKCNIWFVNNVPSLVTESDFNGKNSSHTFETLGKQFDKFYALEESVCGSHIYSGKSSTEFIDPHDKITIVVADLFSDAGEQQTGGVYGYFRPLDLFNNTAQSNENQIIYIDSYFYKKYPDTVYSTIIHEYNHLLNYCQKVVTYGLNISYWFTEMLAMTVEDMFQDYMKIDFESSPKARLVMYNKGSSLGFANWTNVEEDDDRTLYVYANAYALGALLARNFGGVDFVKEIATNQYVDEEAINAAFRKFNKTYKDKNGNETLFDFEMIICSMYKASFNVGSNPGDDYLSFNKQAGSLEDDLHFSAIDIRKIPYINSYGQQAYSAPAFYYGDVQLPAGGYGHSVHYIGSNIKSYILQTPVSSDFVLYSVEFPAYSE